MNALRGLKLRIFSVLFILLMIHVHAGCCFSLFSYSPREFKKGDLLMVKLDKLISTVTQLPYTYYSAPFCRPDTLDDNTSGAVSGYQSEISPYVFNMLEPLTCKVVCRTTLDAESAKAFEEKLLEAYQVNMILDDLPVARHIEIPYETTSIYQLGFNIGLIGQYAGTEDKKYFIHNHLAFTVHYHKDAQGDSAKIIGFEVRPFSVKHTYEGEWNEKANLTSCKAHTEDTYVSLEPQEIRDKEEVIFTYDVVFQDSNVTWESRWDTYLQTQERELHWYAAMNSLMSTFFFLGVVATIMMRTRREISKYNESDMLEETGWKLVHSDVFRPPSNSDLLCIFAGTGVQCFATLISTLIASLLGCIKSSDWGEVWTAILFLWILMGYFGGYASAQLYKGFKGKEWKKIAIKTALVFPAPVAVILVILNAVIYNKKSSSGIACGTMLALVLLWFGISVPLIFIGFYVGFKRQPMEDPVRTSEVPREIPNHSWYKKPITSTLVGGILPLGVVFYELFSILVSLWLHQLYIINSFQLFAFLALLATCGGIGIFLCYLQLCREDYRWWWTSYLISGFSGLYLFLYAAYFFAVNLYIVKPVPILLYFGCMLIGSYAFFVLTGAIGFYACFWFTRVIYSSLKID